MPEPVVDDRDLDTCSTDPFPKDGAGDGCDAYSLHPAYCGNYDTDTFDSNDCCGCSGRVTTVTVEEPNYDDLVCNDNNGESDDNGDDCEAYEYDDMPCDGSYDIEDEFEASDCCACQIRLL